MAPDEDVRKIANDAMTRLNSLQGADFDKAYADAQVRLQTAAVDQFGAYSENGKSGPLKRYAQEVLPRSREFLEYAKRLAGGRSRRNRQASARGCKRHFSVDFPLADGVARPRMDYPPCGAAGNAPPACAALSDVKDGWPDRQ
jgi:hypothetical protein